MTRSRIFGVLVLSALVVTALSARPADVPAYQVIGKLPMSVGGQTFNSFAFDPAINRLYAGSTLGLYWSDLSDPVPRMKGPMIKGYFTRLEIDQDKGRLFYSSDREIGYADLRDGSGQLTPIATLRAADLAYEPTRGELYVAPARSDSLLIYNARTGERGPLVTLPGWFGFELEAVPGRVFLMLPNKTGLFSIDAKTHTAAPFPVEGKFTTPAALEGDRTGKFLFLASAYEAVAIDIANAKVVGRLRAASTPRIAYDRGAGLLISTWADGVHGETQIGAFRPDATGLTEVARLENPAIGLMGVLPTSHGFIQSGHLDLLVWSSERAAVKR